MLVVITYDENGGFWDHVAPPKGDRWGPGSRVPAFIVSPFAKKGFVDHTQYDTTSILRFITRRFDLPVLPGLTPARRRATGERQSADGRSDQRAEVRQRCAASQGGTRRAGSSPSCAWQAPQPSRGASITCRPQGHKKSGPRYREPPNGTAAGGVRRRPRLASGHHARKETHGIGSAGGPCDPPACGLIRPRCRSRRRSRRAPRRRQPSASLRPCAEAR